jgi:hypothetical protein
VVVLATTFLGDAAARAAPTALPLPTWIAAGGGVAAIALSGTTAYIGGGFTYVGPNTEGLAAFDVSSGALDPAWPQLTGDGAVLAPDGAGGWYIAGSFTAVGGLVRQGLAHLRADGTVDPGWAPSVSGGAGITYVGALAVAGSTVYVGGQFQAANGVARNNLAAFDASGVVTSFDPEPNGPVRAMVVAGSTLYVGGAFAVDTPVTRRSYLAAFDVASGTLGGWNPDVDGAVYALAMSGSTIYAGGLFSKANGLITRHNAAAFDLVFGGVTTWNPDVNSTIFALAATGSTVYAGGSFKKVNGTIDRSFLASFDGTFGSVEPFSAPISQNGGDATVYALAVSDGTVYVGGNFTSPRPLLAALDATTGAVTSGSPSMFGRLVTALGVSGSRVFAAGGFSSAGGVVRNHLASVDLTSGEATAWDPNVDGNVSALAISGSTIYAGGSFTTVNGGTPQAGLAAFDAVTGARKVSPTTNGPVDAFAVSGSTVYVGGNFDTLDGTVPRSLAAAFGADTDAVTGFGPGFDMNAYQLGLRVSAVVVTGSTVYVGGTFTAVSALVRHHLAAVQDLPGLVGVLTPFDPDVDDQVSALALSGSTVYAGGAFTSVRGGTPRHHLAAFGEMAGDVTTWDPDANGAVFALALSDPTLYAGGDFTAVNGGIPRNHLAAIDTGTGEATSWDPDADRAVHAVALSPAAGLVAGGDFTNFAGGLRPQPGFAAFALPPAAPTDAAATAGDGEATVSFIAPAATGGAPVLSYTITGSPGGQTAGGAASPIVVMGLTNGTTYTFTVTATNVAGTGPPSAPSNAVTPGTGPGSGGAGPGTGPGGGGGCDAEPVGPTFASIDCRLAALLARVGAASELGAVRKRLFGRLEQATTRDRHTESLCSQGKRRRTRKAFRPSLAALARFLKILRSRRVRSVPTPLASELRTAATGVRDDMRTLQRHLVCPGSTGTPARLRSTWPN